MKKRKGEVRVGRAVVPYRAYGTGDRCLVCVSGAQQTMAAWRSTVTRFAPSAEVVVFDLPGLGQSKLLGGDPHVTLAEQVAILHAVVVAATPGRRRILCGASWGTMVAADYAARCPDRVHGLILGSFGVKPSPALQSIIHEGLDLYDSHRLHRVAHLILERFGRGVNDAYRQRIIRQFERLDRRQAMTLYRLCQFVGSCSSIDDFIDLGAIRAPTLVINGREDPILDPEDAQVATARIRNCRSIVVDGVGHFLHFENPAVLDLYGAFIDEVAPVRSPASAPRGGLAPATA